MRSLLLAVLLSAPAAAAPVEVWTRPAAGPPKKALVDPARLEASPVQLQDPHYGAARRWYRAAPLEAVFKLAPPAPPADLALLRFQNGMLVPVRTRDAAELAKLKAWVAVATSDRDPEKGGVWTAEFPPAPRAGAEERDRNPLRFEGHKLVVESGWHPMVPAAAAKGFNPWVFADTLVGIEYVEEAAWYAQFEPADPAAKAGAAVFRGRCQYCHGVSTVGANYGWDFIEPYPMFKHRRASSLSMHLRYREQDAPEKGLMMPAFPEISKPETEAAWKWLEAMGTRGLKRYGAR